jgi:hypothetical protein
LSHFFVVGISKIGLETYLPGRFHPGSS